MPTASVQRELTSRGLSRLVQWTRGVDTELFRPEHAPAFDLPRPASLYTGRVAEEKNLDAFLELDLPGSKLVVDGVTGVLDEDLGRACRLALDFNRSECRAHALSFSWARCAAILLDNLERISHGCDEARHAAPASAAARGHAAP